MQDEEKAQEDMEAEEEQVRRVQRNSLMNLAKHMDLVQLLWGLDKESMKHDEAYLDQKVRGMARHMVPKEAYLFRVSLEAFADMKAPSETPVHVQGRQHHEPSWGEYLHRGGNEWRRRPREALLVRLSQPLRSTRPRRRLGRQRPPLRKHRLSRCAPQRRHTRHRRLPPGGRIPHAARAAS